MKARDPIERDERWDGVYARIMRVYDVDEKRMGDILTIFIDEPYPGWVLWRESHVDYAYRWKEIYPDLLNDMVEQMDKLLGAWE